MIKIILMVVALITAGLGIYASNHYYRFKLRQSNRDLDLLGLNKKKT